MQYTFLLLVSFFGFFTSILDKSSETTIAGTEWRLTQYNSGERLRVINHLVTLNISNAGKSFTANDGCGNISGGLQIGKYRLELAQISIHKSKCNSEQKSQVARKFIQILKDHTEYKIKDNYLIFYKGGVAQLVFAKIVSDGNEDVTILRRSCRVEPAYAVKNKRKMLQVFDYIDNKYLYLERIEGFDYKPGKTYEIHLEMRLPDNKPTSAGTYKLIKIVNTK